MSGQVGFDDPCRTAINQDVVGVNVQARDEAVLVCPNGVAGQWLTEDARRPRALQLVVTVIICAHAHDVAELQPRYESWIANLRCGRLENAKLPGIFENR